MVMTKGGSTQPAVETRDQGGNPHGQGSGGIAPSHSTTLDGSADPNAIASENAHPAGNDASTGAAGVPSTQAITNTPLPKGTGAGQGTVTTPRQGG